MKEDIQHTQVNQSILEGSPGLLRRNPRAYAHLSWGGCGLYQVGTAVQVRLYCCADGASAASMGPGAPVTASLSLSLVASALPDMHATDPLRADCVVGLGQEH